MKKALEKAINNFLSQIQLSLMPQYITQKPEYLKIKKKDIKGNYNVIIKRKGLYSLKAEPNGNGLVTTKVEKNIIPLFDIHPDHKADSLFPKWWHKLIFWKKFKYQDFRIKREFLSIKDLL